jgi:glyoxylase-like metal-dependent hydrolase (beta-lactamase superfamily II)/rhodanese-related sulfurtransferase
VYFAQHYLDCLSQASYLIADETTGRAVVVDPRRDVSEYLADARARGFTIEAVINTHFHADFIAGHLELAASTGAWIGYGRRAAQAEYPIRRLADHERISLGEVTLEVRETPGHTPESISILVYEHANDPVAYGVLTGDALFIGDVGRPDLLASLGLQADELGRMLYDSVQHTLMGLPDEVRVFPAHGAGSACGKNLSTERQSTIGAQRLTNYACAPMSEEEFVALVTDGQPSAPGYFGFDAVLNRKQHALLDVGAHARPLAAADFLDRRANSAVVIDVRDPQEYAAAHLRGSLNVPADGRFAERAGMVIEPGTEMLVIAPPGSEEEVITRLGRIGLDTVTGYLPEPEAVFLTVPAEVEQASRLTAGELRAALGLERRPVVLDVRNSGELEQGRIDGSVHIPLAELPKRLTEVPDDYPIVVYCAGGVRSSIAASVLRRAGRRDVSDLIGGEAAWRSAVLQWSIAAGVRGWLPGDGLVARPVVDKQALGLRVDLLDALLQVQRLAERLPDVARDAQVYLAPVALGVEEVDAVRVAVRDFLLDGDAFGLEAVMVHLQRLDRVHPPGDLMREHAAWRRGAAALQHELVVFLLRP